MTKRDHRIATSVTGEFKQKIREEAAKRGMTMSEYLRALLEEDIEAPEGNPTLASTMSN